MKKLLNLDSIKNFYVLFFAFAFIFTPPAFAKKKEPKEDITPIVELHQKMNEKHGKTASYYANLYVADGEYDKAYKYYMDECKLGSVMSCLNAYYIGEERALAMYDSPAFVEALQKSIRVSIAACKQGESLGCANVFFAFDALNDENDFITNAVQESVDGFNNESLVDKALKLTKQECGNDDATSCFLYARMQRSIDNYMDVEEYIDKGLDLGYVLAPFVHLPMQSPQTINYFKRSCSLNEALSCKYVAYWFDKYENDTIRANEFYKKACNLGLNSACDNARKSKKAKLDEMGSPTLQY